MKFKHKHYIIIKNQFQVFLTEIPALARKKCNIMTS